MSMAQISKGSTSLAKENGGFTCTKVDPLVSVRSNFMNSKMSLRHKATGANITGDSSRWSLFSSMSWNGSVELVIDCWKLCSTTVWEKIIGSLFWCLHRSHSALVGGNTSQMIPKNWRTSIFWFVMICFTKNSFNMLNTTIRYTTLAHARSLSPLPPHHHPLPLSPWKALPGCGREAVGPQEAG